jgi:Flp pilus assembly protein TadB
MHAPTDRPTFKEMFEELMDMTAGLNVMLMPLLLLAVPGIILFVVLPGLLLLAAAAPLALIAAIVAGPPYLLVRALRRRRNRTGPGPRAAASAKPESRSIRPRGAQVGFRPN